jgi:hypothetical protein
MEVKQSDLLDIKSGASITYECKDGRQCESIRERCYRINRIYSRQSTKLSVSVNWKDSKVTVKRVRVCVSEK